MENGSVIYISPQQNMLVISHDEGFSVVELLGDEGFIERGDTLMADWSELGSGTICRGAERFDVYFQGTWVSAEQAIHIAYRTGGGR